MTRPSTRNAPEPVEEEEAGRGGRTKLLIIGLVVLLAAAGAAYFFLFAGKAEAEAQEGSVVTLQPVTVNLATGGYLKVGVALQFTEEASSGGGHGGELDGSKALDLLISQYSGAQPADVTSAREALKADLEKKIVEAYHGDVMDIYFTEYVTQ